MALKDLFNKETSEKVLPITSMSEVGSEIESAQLVDRAVDDKNRFIPQVDFSKPSNFAFFGLSSDYYNDAISYIINDYPYDGSRAEKVSWQLSASYLDRYIFENEYPRTNGYVNLGVNYGAIVSSSSDYSLFTGGSYITFRGGPHTASEGMIGKPLSETFSNSNILDSTTNRETNLKIDGDSGITVEFWLKRNSFVSGSESAKQVILDVWNSASISSSDYGRFRIEIRPGVFLNEFFIELMSGSEGLSSGSVDTATSIGNGITISNSGWQHYSLSIINSGAQMTAKLYNNGVLNDTIVTGSSIGTIRGPMLASIGSLITQVSGTVSSLGWSKLSGSLDEFRFWKTRRTAKQIGRFWFDQVGAGTNTDEANTSLGVYYKFNEGIISTGSVVNLTDTIVLDYSGRVSNGKFVGYVSGSRSVNSAMVESGAGDFEFRDPILYATHPNVMALIAEKERLAYAHDSQNNAALYNSFPEWITTDDEEKEHRVLRKTTQTMASYFDNLFLQIQELPKIKNLTYTSGSTKPYPFVARFLESSGMIAPEIFTEAQELEAIVSRDDFILFTEKLSDIKNKIYKNVYNNLPYIYKSKGTEKSFRNLIRCFGVDEELIKINLYGDGVTYDLKNNYRYTAVRKKYADFNNVDRFDSTVYQHTSSAPSSRSFIAAPLNVLYHGNTFECEAIFPKKFGVDSQLYFETPFTTTCIYGSHTSRCSETTDKEWIVPDYGNFQVYAVREFPESKSAYFMLSGTNGKVLPVLTSSVFKDVYDNNRWLFAVRIKPSTHPWADGVSGSTNNDFIVEFSGHNTSLDIVNNSFTISERISSGDGSSFMTSPKRFFVGAHRTNFTGSVLDFSDVKISNLRVWMKYLSDEELLAHSKDASNYGSEHPSRNTYMTELTKPFGRGA